MPSASPFVAFLPLRTLSVLGLVCVFALTSCATGGEETDTGPAPSVISPDALVTCEDHGDCGEPGSVRWSLPLEDAYQMARPSEDSSQEASRIVPPGLWLDSHVPDPGAAVADGLLYYHREDLVTAIDTVDGAELWTEDFDGLVSNVQTVGEALVVRTRQAGEEGGRIHLFHPRVDGLEPLETDLPEDLLTIGPVATNDTHLVVREGLTEHGDGAVRFHLVDAGTGEVEWIHSEHAEMRAHGLADDNTLYLRPFRESDDDPHRIVGIADGLEVSEFDLPEDVDWLQRVWATSTGQVLFNGRRCVPGEGQCGSDRVTAVDSGSGEVLWALEEAGAIVSLTSDGPDTQVHIELRRGYQTVDARTGEVLAEGEEAAGETGALLNAFEARRVDLADAIAPELLSEEALEELEAEGRDTVALLEEALDMVPAELVGPGVDGVVLDGLAAGPRHLTTYQADGGEAVGVFLGCAPGEVRPPSWDEASPEAVCAEPRLFAVDYGV
ncbi:outer membrane protein assembly factor BamB family protein [Nocardiopsis valliformis]|uniref:outer membrane protein assembly factor BamB family protein n=1 Tax=Nocardiopsis valliformis TaxID=239974 RepID=UPI0003461D08|nr:PQQ-binding-like beta-propeller repeat protein [Nocardiopsis valliformis]